jgi:uncharacterized protein YbjT (DUF2867 family)
MARNPAYLAHQVGANIEVVAGDVMNPVSLAEAMRGVHTAYYLIHSMSGAPNFEESDRTAARNFVRAAAQAGVQRIIYLGGLGNPEDDLSPHLRSRQEVGAILQETEVECIEFRASIIIGSGSLSFEMIRALVERLPVMITPKWVSVLAQPISIGNVLTYLEESLSLPFAGHRVFEIGGTDVVSYGEIMKEYARQRGLRRWMIPVPVITPYLSSLWLGLVTPVYARVGRSLVDSLRNPTIVRDKTVQAVFAFSCDGLGTAIAEALQNEHQAIVQTRWCDSRYASGNPPMVAQPPVGPRFIDARRLTVPLPPEQAFAPIQRIGGQTGWYYGNFLWRLRGWLDLLAGGIGRRRGRRDPVELHVGDALDWWRVEAYEPNHLLRLYAEMKLPGQAWLQFEVEAVPEGSVIRQTAIFYPLGLWGLVYWYLMYPIHFFLFGGMLKRIARAAVDSPPQAVVE